MALIVDEQSNFKHFCKICKKGFLCGRALGGHMRAHGISGDESDDDDDHASDWEDKSISSSGGSIIPPSSNKRMYALRTNPNNRGRSSRVCENCGKEFISWKAFLEHGNGKCYNSEDTEESGLFTGSDNDGHGGRRGGGWSKRKRSFRMTPTTTNTTTTTMKLVSEEEDLANCLMMLSNASESYASEAEHQSLQQSPQPILPAFDPSYKAKVVSSGNPKGLFECKACKKVFNSHQALGGHRASHKKVKGCFAARLNVGHDQDNVSLTDTNNNAQENILSLGTDQELFMKPSKSTLQLDQHGEVGGSSSSISKKKSKVHQCSICHRVFSSGQALGGHKRCHWITSNNAPNPLTLARFQQLQDQIEQVQDQFAHSTDPTILDLNNIPVTKNNIGTDPRNRLSFEVSTDIFLQSNWGGGINIEVNKDGNYKTTEKKTTDNNSIYQSNCTTNNIKVEDEAESKVKLAKLGELKDHMSISGNSSPWLQVGIGSSITLEVEP